MTTKPCKHYIIIYEDIEEENWITGEKYYTEVPIEKSFLIDLDLHRYKCTKCGEIGYYSGAARDYYEKGIKSEVLRLQ
jgi:hypothetical protein